MYLTRKEKFSASHRLNTRIADEFENIRIFGKRNNINGYGHNYTVKVTVHGHVNVDSGMLMNLTDLDLLMQECIMEKLDHKNLDLDVDFFRDRSVVTTCENVCQYIWNQLVDRMPAGVRLFSIRLKENNLDSAEIRDC